MNSTTGLFSVLLCFISFAVHSQTGPGGVGNNSSNPLWLKANTFSLTDGDRISSWDDESGNSNPLTQPNASFQPEYKTSILNGLPVVRFNLPEGRLRNTAFPIPTTGISAIYVSSNSESNDGILSYTRPGRDNDFLLFNSSNLQLFVGGTSNTSGISANDGVFHIMNAGWQSSNGAVSVWKDGSLSYTTTGFRTGTSMVTGGSLALANEQDAPDASYEAIQDHIGDFAEVIMFDFYLNEAQQIIVSNYLAAKYNLTISNNYFAYQSTHSSDVAGIGRENATNTHTEASSDTVLTIGNASDLNVDQEYLLFGHDGADVNTTWTTTETPNSGTNIQRLAREWRLDETGEVGTVDITIDTDNFPALPAGHTMYAVMIDTDGDFSTGTLVYELTLSAGTEYIANGLNLADGDFVAIAAVRPILDHSLATSSGFETSNAVINVELNFIPATDKTVTYTTADGTALSAQPDYTSAASSLTILAGSASNTYTINLTNDVIVEPTETFSITLSAPTAGLILGPNAIHTFSINDDDNSRKIYFNAATSSGLESVTSGTITVSINNADGINPTTVNYAISSGTAVGSGTDYTLASGTLTIVAGSTSGTIAFTINDDALFETDETFIVSLSSPTNCNLDGVMPLGGTGFLTHTYTITDNDSPPTIEFSITSFSANESTSTFLVPIELNTSAGVNSSATYTVTGTATNGSDFTLASGAIVITAGNTSGTISLPISDDTVEELNETIIITLSAPVNSTLGTDIVFTYTIIDNDLYGCDGPGGVGDATNNKLWVKPEDLAVVADATDITTWPDVSGNSHDLTQSNASFTPRYYNNILNSKPAVRFDQANGRLIHNSFADFPSSAITTIFVNRNSDSGDGFVSYATTANNNEYLLFNSANAAIYRQASNISTGTTLNGNTFRIFGTTWQSSNGNARTYINGTQQFTGTISTGTNIVTGGCLALAGEQDAVDGGYASGQSHQGDFMEVIIYNDALNSARRKIVDNYLSAKYNLAIANDFFSYDAPGNFEHEVAGIGRDDANNFHLAAKGSAIVKIKSPNDLDNGEYLIWGHDNATSAFNDSDVPPTVDNRVNRIWRADETGSVGTITVTFDLSAFTIGSSSDLVLLIDSDDGSFVNSAITPLTSFAGSTVTFENIDLDAGDWFTVGTLSSSNTLPIILTYFDATFIENHVRLDWQTATEINNDYFTIEKSLDGKNWELVKTIEGAGNSFTPLNYSTIDSIPFEGRSYYQLKQTDSDGQFDYSNPVTVFNNSTAKNSINVYPNPTNGILTIELDQTFNNLFRIYTTTGKDLTSLTKLTAIKNSQIQLDLSNLPKGLYFISIEEKVYRVVKE